jgi:hypothetical protein
MDFAKLIEAIEKVAVSINDSAIMQELGKQANGPDYDCLMSNHEKELAADCPWCKTSYGQGWSEVDADGNCRVTCGYCENYLEYSITWIE